jgi:hypothetical protein
MTFYYITVATKPHKVLDRLKQRLNRQGEEIIVLGSQEDRYIGWQSSGNFGIKLREVQTFLQRSELDENDIVLFTDAYDVLYYGDRYEILRRYLEFNVPIVFGSEMYCNPVPSYAEKYPFRDAAFPYLNSGLFIGRVGALRACMKDYMYEDKHDDQLFWTQVYLSNPNLISLDYHHSLFFNTAGTKETDVLLQDGKCYFYGADPLFVHVNGPDKGELDRFLREY